MKNKQNSKTSPPPEELVKKAAELWGREVKQLSWEKVDFGPEYMKRHGERAFVCTHGQACEVIHLNLYRLVEQSRTATYGVGKCLSCEVVYWGRVGE